MKISKPLIFIMFVLIVGSNYAQKIKSALIGKQEWQIENLNVTTFRNGDKILEAKTEQEWILACENEIPAWCYYDNDPTNGAVYGKLYNWYAVVDKRGLAPIGWHVPSIKEYETLFRYLDPKTNFSPGDVIDSLSGVYQIFSSDLVGEKLKSKSGWENSVLYPNKLCGVECNGNNLSGFNAKPSTHRNNYAYFMKINSCYFWTSITGGPWDGGYFIDIENGTNKASLNVTGPNNGLAVRCIKD
jgi:uncharacterized protein (TIGR02145 family)